jgi:hypothetical protein
MLYSQVSTWRQTGGSVLPQTTQSAPRVQPSVPQQQNNVSSWRNNSPQQSQTQPDRRGRVFVQNWNRQNQFGYYWGNWGWYQPMPYIWYDDFGWRQRSIIHVYENGRKDTVKGKPLYVNLGIQFSGKNMLGGYITIGNKGYFIIDYLTTNQMDNITKYTLGSDYFPNKSLSDVDFPIISSNIIKRNIFYLGGGKMINNKTGFHVMIGFGNDNKIYRGQDKIGYLTFPNKETFTTVKFGLLHNYKNLGLKLDYDPIKEIFTWGLGIHL